VKSRHSGNRGLEDELNKLRIYHDRAGTAAGLQSLVIETKRDDHVLHVVTHDVGALVDSSAGSVMLAHS